MKLQDALDTWKRHRKHGTMPPQRTMNTIVSAAKLVANPNILAAARARYSEAERFTFTQKQWDKIMEETSQIVDAALTPQGDT